MAEAPNGGLKLPPIKSVEGLLLVAFLGGGGLDLFTRSSIGQQLDTMQATMQTMASSLSEAVKLLAVTSSQVSDHSRRIEELEEFKRLTTERAWPFDEREKKR